MRTIRLRLVCFAVGQAACKELLSPSAAFRRAAQPTLLVSRLGRGERRVRGPSGNTCRTYRGGRPGSTVKLRHNLFTEINHTGLNETQTLTLDLYSTEPIDSILTVSILFLVQ